jgi:uronate dehydrogenase
VLDQVGQEHPSLGHRHPEDFGGWYDNSNATRLGYRPQDNAESFSKEVLAREKRADPRSEPYQGGIFVDVEEVPNPAAERQGAKK